MLQSIGRTPNGKKIAAEKAGELKGLKFKKGLFPWTASGCAVADSGLLLAVCLRREAA